MGLGTTENMADDFELAFAASIEGIGEPAAGEPAAGEPAAGEPAAGEPAAGEPAAGEPAAGEPAAGEPAAGEPAAGEPAATKTNSPSPEETAAAEEVQRLRDEALAREQYTTEETTAIEALVSDFPEVAAALKAELRVLHAKVENAYHDKLNAELTRMYQYFAPALNEATTSARSRFEADVKSKHADAFALVPEVEKWIATKPGFLQAAYNQVLDAGTAEDTIKLLDLFKSETKPAAPAAKEGAAPPQVDPEKVKKLASQEGVRGRQTQKTGGIDEDDFESAFLAGAARN